MKRKVSIWWILVAVFAVPVGLTLIAMNSPSKPNGLPPDSTAEGCQRFARSVSREFVKPNVNATGFSNLRSHIGDKGECNVIEDFEYESSKSLA